MDDLAGEQLREQRLPFVALRVIGDLAREGLVAQQKTLCEIEQSLPELAFDARGAVSMLEVLRGEHFAQRIGMRIDVKDSLQPCRGALRLPLAEVSKLCQERGVHGERIVRWEPGQPAFRRLRVGEGVFDGLTEAEHRRWRPVPGTLLARSVSRPCNRAGFCRRSAPEVLVTKAR